MAAVRAGGEVSRAAGLPPEIRHLLAAVGGPVADRAEQIFRVVLAGRLAERTPRAWRGSRLTGDGYPIEVAFSTADDRLRLTLEPGPRGARPTDGLDRVDTVLDQCAGRPLAPAARGRLAALQAGGPLRYGAWLGCRLGSGDPAFKVYAEVPDGVALGAGWPAPLELSDRAVVPRMVAVAPDGEPVETYFRVPSLRPEHLPAVLDPVGLADRSGPLLGYLEEAYGHPVRGRIPGPSVGVSYVLGAAPRVSLHLYARAVWGGDARIRRGFLQMARAGGWDTGAYEAVSAPLASRDGWRTCHALLGITPSGEGVPVLTLGLRPVAP